MLARLARLLNRDRSGLARVVELVRDIAEIASSRRDFRARLAEAAKRGDLDDAFDRFASANARAIRYVEDGK